MNVEHHDLVHEFPEFRHQIHELKMNNHHFRRLFDKYHELTNSIEAMENEGSPVSTTTKKAAKGHRVHLKDELYKMLMN